MGDIFMNNALTELIDTKEEIEIKDIIYEFIAKQLMLDSDIATLFEFYTSRLNEQMKRNQNRFPQDFSFQLNSLEFKSLKSQNAISNSGRGGRRKLPYVYTEQGIIALAGVLKSEVADQMCIWIS